MMIVLALLAGCGEPTPQPTGQGSTTPRYERVQDDASLLPGQVAPVRIGESGPSFAACAARATTRNLAAGSEQRLPLRAAPFESAKAVGALQPGATFFICSRSIDQRWFGIVLDTEEGASLQCGVSAPVPARRDYDGPCRSGWVSSAYVKLIGR